jgi:hypothetical protein
VAVEGCGEWAVALGGSGQPNQDVKDHSSKHRRKGGREGNGVTPGVRFLVCPRLPVHRPLDPAPLPAVS